MKSKISNLIELVLGIAAWALMAYIAYCLWPLLMHAWTFSLVKMAVGAALTIFVLWIFFISTFRMG